MILIRPQSSSQAYKAGDFQEKSPRAIWVVSYPESKKKKNRLLEILQNIGKVGKNIQKSPLRVGRFFYTLSQKGKNLMLTREQEVKNKCAERFLVRSYSTYTV